MMRKNNIVSVFTLALSLWLFIFECHAMTKTFIIDNQSDHTVGELHKIRAYYGDPFYQTLLTAFTSDIIPPHSQGKIVVDSDELGRLYVDEFKATGYGSLNMLWFIYGMLDPPYNHGTNACFIPFNTECEDGNCNVSIRDNTMTVSQKTPAGRIIYDVHDFVHAHQDADIVCSQIAGEDKIIITNRI